MREEDEWGGGVHDSRFQSAIIDANNRKSGSSGGARKRIL